MGMDLLPRAPIEVFHANWYGWSLIQALLYLLGCNLEHMDGSNDGKRVPARHAKAWGKAVKKAIKEGLVAATIRSRITAGGKKVWIIPPNKKDYFLSAMGAAVRGNPPVGLLEAHLILDAYLSKDEKPSPQLDLWDKPNQFIGFEEVSPQTIEFLDRFATFCINSRGFEQC